MSPLSVLYIDDDRSFSERIRSFFERTGEARVEICTVREGWNQAIGARYDGIIYAHLTPKGITFLREVRKKSNIPFIFFSENYGMDLMGEALNAGADYYLGKEGEPEESFGTLLEVLKRTVARKQECQDALFQYRSLVQKNEQLAASEEQYRTIIENCEDVLYVRCDDRFLLVNKRAVEISRYTEEELLQIPIADLIFSETPFNTGADRSGERISIQFHRVIRTKSGRIAPLECTEQPIQFCGSPAILGVCRDVLEYEMIVQILTKRVRTLTIVNKIIVSVCHQDLIENLLHELLQGILDLLGYDAGGMYLVDSKNKHAKIISAVNIPSDFYAETDNLDIHQQPYDRIFILGRSIISENYEDINPERAEKYHLKSIISVPIFMGNTIIGALNAISSERSLVSEDDRTLIESIGREIGIAVKICYRNADQRGF